MNRVEKRTSRNMAPDPTSNNSSNTAPRAVSVELLQGGRVLRSLKPLTVFLGGGRLTIRELLDVIRGGGRLMIKQKLLDVIRVGGRLMIRRMLDLLSSPLSLLL